MTDAEPRRSGRKTKGQHTRNSEAHELLATPAPKATPRRKPPVPKQPTPAASSPAVSTPQTAASEDEETDEDDDPNAIIRCACGATQDVKGDPRMMVQCEGCKAWQHCECLDLDENDLEDEDKLYYCEVCKPELHTVFFARVEKGDYPWEAAKKNKGKKKKGSRKSTGSRSRSSRAKQKKKTTKKDQEPEPEVADSSKDHPENESVKDSADGSEVPQDTNVIDPELRDEPLAAPITEEDKPEEEKVEANVEPVEVNVEPVPQENGKHGEGEEETSEPEKLQVDVEMEEKPIELDPSSKPVEEEQEEAEVKTDDAKEVGEKMEICEEPAEMNESEKELAPESSMPPPNIPPIQSSLPLEKQKEDESMPDAPSRGTSMTPTTPTMTRHRDAKRKVSAAESTRSVRRKTTHDSDGEYNSDSDSGPNKPRRTSATSMPAKETPKELKETAPPRRVSVAKPVKKQSGPDDLSIQLELVEKVDDLRNNARRNIVNYLSPIIQAVVKKNSAILSPEQKEENFPEKLSIEIEHHLYLELWNQHTQPTSQYKMKARGIGLNLPKNPLLQSRLLKGEVTPEKLVQMKPEEMASEEFQLLAEQVRRESELHNTIVAEESGPRIRRTHKGEEIVEDEIDQGVGNDEPVYSASRGADNIMEDPPSAPRSRTTTPAIDDSRTSPPQSAHSQTEDASHAGSAPQTPRTPSSAKTPVNRGRQFSMESVWSNINTPDHDQVQRPSSARLPPQQLLSIRQQPKLAIDADIDKLLAEEDHDMDNETPPYSPSELTFSETALPVWRGRFSMINVANFSARANYLGGPPNAQSTLPLGDLLASIVLVDGRIAIDRATEYLCGQKFSSTNEIVVLSIEPEDHLEPNAQGEFNKLFQYFLRKERYGVIGKPPHKAVKDCYLVPIDERDDMPDFFETLPNHTLEPTPRKKRVFAVIFVLSKIALAEERRLKEASRAAESPRGPSAIQGQGQSPYGGGASASPGAFVNQQHQQQPQGQVYPPQQHQQQQQYHHQQQQPQGYPPQAQYQGYPPPTNPVGQPNGGNNGYGYYQPSPPQHQQQQHQQLPIQQAPPPPPPPPQQPPQSPIKRFSFTPWKELQDALPHLTIEQVNTINKVVALHPAAKTDPLLLAKLIKEE